MKSHQKNKRNLTLIFSYYTVLSLQLLNLFTVICNKYLIASTESSLLNLLSFFLETSLGVFITFVLREGGGPSKCERMQTGAHIIANVCT